MKKVTLVIGLILILMQGICACGYLPNENTQLFKEEKKLYRVAEDIQLKMGTNFDSKDILENGDFVGFNYGYDELTKLYVFTFKLTEDGQKEMGEATENLPATSGDLSLWIGEERITSGKVQLPLVGWDFIITLEQNEGAAVAFVDKLKEK